MSSTNSDVVAFRCEQCDKRLKAPLRLAGKKVQCPRCSNQVRVPSASEGPLGSRESASDASRSEAVSQPAPVKPRTSLLDSDDPFQLNAPAIENLSEREQSAKEIRDEKSRQREIARQKAAARRSPADSPRSLAPASPAAPISKQESNQPVARNVPADDLIPFDSDDELSPTEKSDPTASEPRQASTESEAPRSELPESTGAGAPEEPAVDASVSDSSPQKRSIFDDDLPELEALIEDQPRRVTLPPMGSHDSDDARSAPARNPLGQRNAGKRSQADEALGGSTPAGRTGRSPSARAPEPEDDLDDLENLLPELAAAAPLKPLHEEEVLANAHYRVVCPTCGTPQYVTPSAQGMKIKCPDCFDLFKAPPPPKDWKPKPMPKLDPDADIGLAKEDGLAEVGDNPHRRGRTQDILDKAAAEISEEEQEQRYDYDFDTAGFVQRTFGFLRDPLTIVQMLGYGFVFACLFWIAQFGANDTESQFGRGMLLLTVVVLPIVAFLFALPMLSGGLALIEAVANKQKYVREIPAFNIFDNFADVLVIAVALAASMMPGLLIGMFLSNEDNGLYLRVGGVMASTFVLFPIFLLSMMDNGSFFPISGAIIRSLGAGAESWGSYYLKTLIACFVTLILWFMLLGRQPMLAAIAGFTVPVLLFFICQQIGGLADAIGDHLSFEFVPPSDDEDRDGDDA